VHLSVRADRYDGVRLSPRKVDLNHWRAVFARNLQDRGVNAVASRQPIRAANRNYRKLWEERAAGRGQLIRQQPAQRMSARSLAARADAIKAWEQIARRWPVHKTRPTCVSRWRRSDIWRRSPQVGKKRRVWLPFMRKSLGPIAPVASALWVRRGRLVPGGQAVDSLRHVRRARPNTGQRRLVSAQISGMRLAEPG
jgi:hypothetical protein